MIQGVLVNYFNFFIKKYYIYCNFHCGTYIFVIVNLVR